jgi:tight adherence protein C
VFPFVLALLAGGGVGLVCYGFSIGDSADAVSMRLNQFARPGISPPSLREVEMAESARDRLLRPAMEKLAKIAGNMHGRATIERMEKSLLQAGSPNGMTVEDLLGTKGLAALIVGGLAFFFGIILGQPTMRIIIFVGVGVVVGYMLPSLAIKQKAKKRQKEIIKVLPDAVDMLSISVEAGLGFDAAMARLSSKMKNELTAEFDRVASEIRLGRRRRDAMRNMIHRTGVEDLSAFINSLIQADQLGVSVTNVLKTQAQTMRVKRRQRAEEKARKAPVKMMFPLVCLLFPPLMIIILGPAIPTLVNGMK